jgi:hypothetical protein
MRVFVSEDVEEAEVWEGVGRVDDCHLPCRSLTKFVMKDEYFGLVLWDDSNEIQNS